MFYLKEASYSRTFDTIQLYFARGSASPKAETWRVDRIKMDTQLMIVSLDFNN